MGDLFSQDFAVAPPQTVHGGLNSRFAHPESRANFGVTERAVLTRLNIL
jgi:hypothetical protein